MHRWTRAILEAAAEFARGIDTASAIRHGVPLTPRDNHGGQTPAVTAERTLSDSTLRN